MMPNHRHGIAAVLAALVLAIGCGPTDEEKLADPEIQRKIREGEERHRAEIEQMHRESQERERRQKELANPPPDEKPKAEESPADANQTIDTKSAPPEQPPTTAPQQPVPVAKSAPSDNPWQSLRAGLSQAEVETLLGKPTATSRDAYLVYWHYGRGDSAGRIALTRDGKLIAWDRPVQ
jgi:hypothetical protein